MPLEIANVAGSSTTAPRPSWRLDCFFSLIFDLRAVIEGERRLGCLNWILMDVLLLPGSPSPPPAPPSPRPICCKFGLSLPLSPPPHLFFFARFFLRSFIIYRAEPPRRLSSPANFDGFCCVLGNCIFLLLLLPLFKSSWPSCMSLHLLWGMHRLGLGRGGQLSLCRKVTAKFRVSKCDP